MLAVARSICWGTHEEAARLGVEGAGTRQWAYRWIEEHVRHLAPVGVLVDIGGGGVDGALCTALAPHASEVIVVDRIGEGRRRGRVREHSADLERGVTGFSDDSVDVFVSASAIEHLTAGAQRRLFADVQRILKPGGVFCGTVSFIAGLTPETLAVIQSDPLFEQTGSAVHAAFDLRACLAAAPLLRPPYPPLTWSQFPYFDGFDESDLIGSDAIIVNYVGSYGAMRFRPEVDALRLRWAELGLFLRKQAA